jgi:Vacuolar protein sorting-associated protein 62
MRNRDSSGSFGNGLALHSVTVALAALVLAACGGGGGGGSSSAAPAATPKLATSVNLDSISANGGTTLIAVDALDKDGKREAYTIDSQGSSANASIVAEKISVSALSVGKQDIHITTASGVKKTITVQVYDPLAMDIGGGLQIGYVNQFDAKFDNSFVLCLPFVGCNTTPWGYNAFKAWNPKKRGPGWYALGSYIRNDWADVNASRDVPMVIVKDTSVAQDRLAAPTGFTRVWTSGGSGIAVRASLWKPICPSGFKALGIVASSGNNPDQTDIPPSTEDVRCVNASQVVAGKAGPWITDDFEVGACCGAMMVWKLERPDNLLPAEGFAFLPPGTVVAGPPLAGYQNNSSVVDPAIVNVLKIEIPVVRFGDAKDYEPRLSGYTPFDARVSRAASGVRVPFQLISDPDPTHTLDWKMANSPFYTIVREESYSANIPINDNRQGTNSSPIDYSTEFGWSQTDYTKFSQELGVEVTTGGDVKFASWEVKISVKLGWEQSTSTAYSSTTTTTFHWDVPAGKYAQVLHVMSQMRVFTETGQNAGTLPMKSNILKYMQYP